jgi:hypothetical protein
MAPISAPALIAFALFSAVYRWNDFLLARGHDHRRCSASAARGRPDAARGGNGGPMAHAFTATTDSFPDLLD